MNPKPEHSALYVLSKHRLRVHEQGEQWPTSSLCPQIPSLGRHRNSSSVFQRIEGLGPRLYQRLQREQRGILPAWSSCLPSSDSHCRHGLHKVITTDRPQQAKPITMLRINQALAQTQTFEFVMLLTQRCSSHLQLLFCILTMMLVIPRC